MAKTKTLTIKLTEKEASALFCAASWDHDFSNHYDPTQAIKACRRAIGKLCRVITGRTL
jgi:hypothetical protein